MKIIFYLFIIMPFLAISAPSTNYSNFYQTLVVSHLNNSGSGSGYGSVSVVNNLLTVSFGGGWTPPQTMRTGIILTVGTSPNLPNMELGPVLLSSGSGELTGYHVKIENNKLVFYSLGNQALLTSCYFYFTISLDCIDSNGSMLDPNTKWFLDDDLDEMGDPMNFVIQCNKPQGNYILDSSDLCPLVYGSVANCSNLSNFSNEKNYLKTTTYKIETNSSLSTTEPNQATIQVQYFDGLGRPIQQVAHKQSNSGKDIIVHIGYDEFGRQNKKYLPYVRSSASLNYDSDGEVNTSNFYNSNDVAVTGNYHFEITGNPYSEKVLESSPLSRVFEQAAPGNPWEKSLGRTIKFDYQTNDDDEVVYFKAVATWTPDSLLYRIELIKEGHYIKNQLYKTITKDENWTLASGLNNTTEEFKNKQGQVILKRTYADTDTALEVPHDTYYVYDIYGNLTYVIPPKVDVTQTIADDILKGLCYQYKYDSRNRLIAKKLPGKQWEFIVYDKLDRVVATGPALSPFTSPTSVGWLVTKYDKFNRVVLTGWLPATVNSTERKNIQVERNNQITNLSETKINTTSNTTVNGIAFRYTNVAWPTSGYHVLSVNYYDNYNFPNAPTSIPTTVENDTVYYNNTVKPIGLSTGSFVRVPETSTLYKSEVSYMLYDKKGRVLRSRSSNFLGGYTQVDNKLDFSGKVLYTKTRHKRAILDAELLLTDTFTYSDQDKLLTHVHQINSFAPQLLVKNEYDELGQLIVKKVGGTDVTGTTSLQKVDYQYNIRGWLKSINDVDNLQDGSNPLDLFAFKLNYHTVTKKNISTNEIEEVNDSYNQTVKKLYNGNIAETYWRTSNDNTLRKYSYAYDDLNRLLDAHYQKPEENFEQTASYNESMDYDKNGNIVFLERNGEYDDSYTPLQIDQLFYNYNPLVPNQLLQVYDNSTNPNGFKDGNDTGYDYSYDANGNMTSDGNKGITSIVYNHLNLPTKITFGMSGNIQYIYNASGVKVRKIVSEGSITKTTDYLNGFQYINGVLEFFPHGEGYVKKTKSLYNYVFNYRDHLGTIRLTYTRDPNLFDLKILEENNYYPFGLKHRNYNMNKKDYEKLESTGGVVITPTNLTVYDYKYNGKEWQDELGLNMYDYGWRNYDPALGRWMNIDALANRFVEFSPYSFIGNSPIKNIEVDGRWWWDEKDQKRADKYRSNYNSNISKLQKDLSGLEEKFGSTDDEGRKKELGIEINNVKDRIKGNQDAITNLDAIENDTEHGYSFNKVGGQIALLEYGGKVEHKVKGLSDKIIINFLSDSNATHEITHGADVAKGNLIPTTVGYSFSYFPDKFSLLESEVRAYQTEMRVHGSVHVLSDKKFPLRAGLITKEHIQSVYYIDNAGKKQYIYKDIQ